MKRDLVPKFFKAIATFDPAASIIRSGPPGGGGGGGSVFIRSWVTFDAGREVLFVNVNHMLWRNQVGFPFTVFVPSVQSLTFHNYNSGLHTVRRAGRLCRGGRSTRRRSSLRTRYACEPQQKPNEYVHIPLSQRDFPIFCLGRLTRRTIPPDSWRGKAGTSPRLGLFCVTGRGLVSFIRPWKILVTFEHQETDPPRREASCKAFRAGPVSFPAVWAAYHSPISTNKTAFLNGIHPISTTNGTTSSVFADKLRKPFDQDCVAIAGYEPEFRYDMIIQVFVTQLKVQEACQMVFFLWFREVRQLFFQWGTVALQSTFFFFWRGPPNVHANEHLRWI